MMAQKVKAFTVQAQQCRSLESMLNLFKKTKTKTSAAPPHPQLGIYPPLTDTGIMHAHTIINKLNFLR